MLKPGHQIEMGLKNYVKYPRASAPEFTARSKRVQYASIPEKRNSTQRAWALRPSDSFHPQTKRSKQNSPRGPGYSSPRGWFGRRWSLRVRIRALCCCDEYWIRSLVQLLALHCLMRWRIKMIFDLCLAWRWRGRRSNSRLCNLWRNSRYVPSNLFCYLLLLFCVFSFLSIFVIFFLWFCYLLEKFFRVCMREIGEVKNGSVLNFWSHFEGGSRGCVRNWMRLGSEVGGLWWRVVSRV